MNPSFFLPPPEHELAAEKESDAVGQRPEVPVSFLELLTYRKVLRTVLLAFPAFDALGRKARILGQVEGLEVLPPP